MTLKLIIVCFSSVIQIATLHTDNTQSYSGENGKEITTKQRQAIKTIDFHSPLSSTGWHFSSGYGGVCKHKM